MRTGILAGGNFIIDHVKLIDAYPEQDMLTFIRSEWGNAAPAVSVVEVERR